MATVGAGIEISDDDDSFSLQSDTILLSSDDDTQENCLTSDEELPNVDIQGKKLAAVKNLFNTSKKDSITTNKIKDEVWLPAPVKDNASKWSKFKDKNVMKWGKNRDEEVGSSASAVNLEKPKDPGVFRMIEGVNVNLPVNPYGCQVALMSMLIKSIKGSKNCLLESPTGSGKTLALLCGALGWLKTEKDRIGQHQAKQYFSDHPESNKVDGAMNFVSTPKKSSSNNTPEKLFEKNTFGEKSIYDDPIESPNSYGTASKRPEPMDCDEDLGQGQVKIHKKRKLEGDEFIDYDQIFGTPEKPNGTPDSTPEKLSVPTIYYGARTHKQLQQVIKEYGRTSYCSQFRMTVLSSREHSCVREFDKQMWGTKNDMCRGCIKKIPPRDTATPLKREQTNCVFYDNKKALDHSRLPPAFDLEDLVKAGEELKACPYFSAREMAHTADIVFCPYNYLIDPSIRASMRIKLQNNIVIIDEAHNIEDICRDSATFTFTRDSIQAALKELEYAEKYRYSAEDAASYIETLIKILKDWDYWFVNQKSLLDSVVPVNNESVYMWQPEHFATTLQNHNIGRNNYHELNESAEMFCTKLRDEPGSLYGVTQSTGTLVGSLDIALGYLFRQDCKYMDDFKPALVRQITSEEKWKNYRKSTTSQEQIELRLFCMNPAVVFEGLKNARCIVLASGTLTPLISLHSELDTEFPLKISPSHVIPPDRIWIGTLLTQPDGSSLECKSRDTNKSETQDSLGDAVLWVCQVTPHGVLCFLPSYALLNKLIDRWRMTGVWQKLSAQKHVFQESRNAKDHNDIMEDYYKYVATDKGALLFAVYRGKVSEGMDFKDHQARAVITIGVPYPNTFDMAVKAKMDYNDKYARSRNLLTGQEWLKVQAYRALNQAVGRCVRHKNDWGAVLLVDARFHNPIYTEHLSKWVLKFLEKNHHSFESLTHSSNSLESFMQNMTIRENEEF